jgi:UDP-N-acetylglucosamine 3-dehydrogenase
MSGRLRVALLGCGAIGELVARHVYADIGAAGEVVAAIDRRAERAQVVGDRLGAPAFGSLAEAMAHGPVDAVDVRLPHHLHAPAALEALAAGLHVLVEKPMATSYGDARAMIGAAADAGRVLGVAENYPHLHAVRDARAALASIGDVLCLRTTRVFRLEGVWLRDGWRVGDGDEAGLLLDQGTHHASLVRQLGGEVRAVSAMASTGPAARDVVLLNLELETGTPAQCLYCWASPGDDAHAEASVYGLEGRIDVLVDYEGRGGRAVAWPPALLGTATAGENYYDSHRAIVDDWIAAATGGRAPLVDGGEGLSDLAVVLAAQRSLRDGGRVVEIAELAATDEPAPRARRR